MKSLFAATMELQRPEYPQRDPMDTPAIYDVCPHCKRETTVYLEFCEGRVVDTHRCYAHGDVTPMRSVIRNEYVEPHAA